MPLIEFILDPCRNIKPQLATSEEMASKSPKEVPAVT
jgi:hypothetical protein